MAQHPPRASASSLASSSGDQDQSGDIRYIRSQSGTVHRCVDNSQFYSKHGITTVADRSSSMESSHSSSSSGLTVTKLTRIYDGSTKFPKLQECAHFHYDLVELGQIQVTLVAEGEDEAAGAVGGDAEPEQTYVIAVTSQNKTWNIRRTYTNFRTFDRQLHKCIFDRKYSLLPELRNNAITEDGLGALRKLLSLYVHRFSSIAGNMINCGSVLSWLEMDNRGHRMLVTDDSAINTPAIAAAHVVRRYIAQAQDEISLEVGDIISLIDMPPSEETQWWRGKRGFEVGFFLAECVEVIGDTVPQSMTSKIPETPAKPVLRKRGKLISFLRTFFTSRPARNSLKRTGIVKERVFGCDLGEHLLNSGQENAVPIVLKACADTIEAHGIVDGIYRLSGVASNIQRLRSEFDEETVPDLTAEIYMQDIHSISSLLKMYFRELPNPLLTYGLYEKFSDAVQVEEDQRLLRLHSVIQMLPPPHYRTAAFLFKHLAYVATFGKTTGMHGKNLAIVWAPNLMRCKELEQMCSAAALQGVGIQAIVTEYLIHYADLIFSDKLQLQQQAIPDTGSLRRIRPKSLAISTPSKLISLEQAREQIMLSSALSQQQAYIEVGGGPANLPQQYHTVIDVHKGKKRGSKSPASGWRSFFQRKGSSGKENKSELSAAASGPIDAGLRNARSADSLNASPDVGPQRPQSAQLDRRNISIDYYSDDGTPGHRSSAGKGHSKKASVGTVSLDLPSMHRSLSTDSNSTSCPVADDPRPTPPLLPGALPRSAPGAGERGSGRYGTYPGASHGGAGASERVTFNVDTAAEISHHRPASPGLTEAVLGALQPSTPPSTPSSPTLPPLPPLAPSSPIDPKHLSPIEENKSKEDSPVNHPEEEEEREEDEEDVVFVRDDENEEVWRQQPEFIHHQQQQHERQRSPEEYHAPPPQPQQRRQPPVPPPRHSYDVVAVPCGNLSPVDPYHVDEDNDEVSESFYPENSYKRHDKSPSVHSSKASLKSPGERSLGAESFTENSDRLGGNFHSEHSLDQASVMSQQTEISEVAAAKDWRSSDSLASVDKCWIRSVVDSDMGAEDLQITRFGSSEDFMEVEGSKDGSINRGFGSRESLGGSTEKEMSVGSIDRYNSDFDSAENLSQSRSRSNSRELMEISEAPIQSTRQSQAFAGLMRPKTVSPETETPDTRNRLKSQREGLAGSDSFEHWELGRTSGSNKSTYDEDEEEVRVHEQYDQYKPDHVVVGQENKEWIMRSDSIEPEWVEEVAQTSFNQSEPKLMKQLNQYEADRERVKNQSEPVCMERQESDPEPLYDNVTDPDRLAMEYMSESVEAQQTSMRSSPPQDLNLHESSPMMHTDRLSPDISPNQLSPATEISPQISPPTHISPPKELALEKNWNRMDKFTKHEQSPMKSPVITPRKSLTKSPVKTPERLNSNSSVLSTSNELIFQMDQTPESELAPLDFAPSKSAPPAPSARSKASPSSPPSQMSPSEILPSPSSSTPAWKKQLSDTNVQWMPDRSYDVDMDKVLMEEDLDSTASDVDKWATVISDTASDVDKSLIEHSSDGQNWTPLRISSERDTSSEEKERREEKERQSNLKERRRIFESAAAERTVQHNYDEVPPPPSKMEIQEQYGYLADRSTSSSPAPVDTRRQSLEKKQEPVETKRKSWETKRDSWETKREALEQKRQSPVKDTPPKEFPLKDTAPKSTKIETQKRDPLEIRRATPQKDYLGRNPDTAEITPVAKRWESRLDSRKSNESLDSVKSNESMDIGRSSGDTSERETPQKREPPKTRESPQKRESQEYSSQDDSSGNTSSERKRISPVKRKKSVRELLSRFENSPASSDTSLTDTPIPSNPKKPVVNVKPHASSVSSDQDDSLKRSRFTSTKEVAKMEDEEKKSDLAESPAMKKHYTAKDTNTNSNTNSNTKESSPPKPSPPKPSTRTSQYLQRESPEKNSDSAAGGVRGKYTRRSDFEATSNTKPISIVKKDMSQSQEPTKSTPTPSSALLSKSAPISGLDSTLNLDSTRGPEKTRGNIREASEPLIRPGTKAAKLSTSPNVMSKIKAFEVGGSSASDEDELKAQKLKASENVTPNVPAKISRTSTPPKSELVSMEEEESSSERILRPSELFPSKFRRSISGSSSGEPSGGVSGRTNVVEKTNMADKVRNFSSGKKVVLVEEDEERNGVKLRPGKKVESPTVPAAPSNAGKENTKPERTSVKDLWRKFEQRSSDKSASDIQEDNPPWTAIL